MNSPCFSEIEYCFCVIKENILLLVYKQWDKYICIFYDSSNNYYH